METAPCGGGCNLSTPDAPGPRVPEADMTHATEVVRFALDCIITMDRHGRILDFNPAAERVFGYRREDVVGREMAETVIPPSYRDRHRQALRRYLETGNPTILGKRLELTGMRADGTAVA